jgi:hypothetical protein
MAMNVFCGNIGGLISQWSYLPFDGPNYPIANGLNLASTSASFILAILLVLWIQYDNRKRDGKAVNGETDKMTIKEVQELEWQHPAFRWKP